MQTYSHYIITAFLDRQVRNRQLSATPGAEDAAAATARAPDLHTPAFLFGSIAPDLPLILLTLYFAVVDLTRGRSLAPGGDPTQSSVGRLFDDLFFHDPGVIFAHNLFHAPILTVMYTATGYWAWRAGRQWGAALFWFGLACTLHTLIDIPIHYDDGPLIFFPFNWQIRFYAPISYWDPARGGIAFSIFEHLLVLGLLLYLLLDWRKRRRAREAGALS